MKRVLFVTESYLEKNAPNGNCVRHIIDYWKSQESVEADVVCAETSDIDKSINGNNVYPIYYQLPHNPVLNNASKFINMPLTKRSMLKGLERKIKELTNIHQYNAIIAVVNPAEAAEAVYQVKREKPWIQTILYEIDPTSNRYKTPSNFFQKLWRFCCLRWERKIYKSFDKVIHMKTHSRHFSAKQYRQFESKTIYLDIPGLLIRPTAMTHPNNKETLYCLYAGAFYPDLRKPDYMIALFKKLCAQRKAKLDIYTGRMRDYISRLISDSNEDIVLHEVVSEHEIASIQENADILVSIGNKNSDYLPSKILSYIGSGKTILHLYDDNSDVSLPYLQKYPKTIFVDQREDIDNNVYNLTTKLREICNTAVTPEFLLKKFKENTTAYTAERMLDLL